jgi:hypothetical protein
MNRLRSAAWWAVPGLLCLVLYWPSLTAWFRGDDFAWLGAGLYIKNTGDLLRALFGPKAQGTIRPLSERAFFITGFWLFGLDALPFRIVVFATHFANLVLAAWIGARLTGSRAAGACAAVLWLVNSSNVLPLGWTSAYNQVLCGFFLLLALFSLLRYVETGERRYYWWQWAAFLCGFGAQELSMVYPAIAAAYTLLCARKYFRRTLPMFAVSALYFAVHQWAAPAPKSGDYAMHFTGAMLRTFGKYWTWGVGPVFLFTPLQTVKWALPSGVAAVTIGLLGFAADRLRCGDGAAGFCLAWYAIVLAPMLPLRDHMTEYYVFLPTLGLAWLGGWALERAWHGSNVRRVTALVLTAVYLLIQLPTVTATTRWNHESSLRVRALVEGVEVAHALHPKQSILLEGVDSELFWQSIRDKPFRLFGLDNVYLAPGSERSIDAHPDLGDVGEFVLPAGVVANGLARDEIVVYDVRGPRLRNVTSVYAAMPRDTGLPRRIDAASPLTQYLLGPEWYPSDGDHRWMPKRATLRIGGPDAPGRKLYLRGDCPEEQLKAGALDVTVSVDHSTLPAVRIEPGHNAFELALPIPDRVVGKSEMTVTIEVSRVIRPASDPRDLGLVFGVIEVK